MASPEVQATKDPSVWAIDWLSTPAGAIRLGRARTAFRGPSTPTVLIIPGRGDSLELRAWVAARLARMGADVVMAEHLGQGGSRALGRHPGAVHVGSFSQHLDAVEAVLEGINGPAYLLAHSMGGLLAAHLLARHPDRFAGAVLTSPMWRFAGVPTWLAAALAKVALLFGWGDEFALGEGPFSLQACTQMRTSGKTDRDQLVALAAFATAYPELVRGGSTWGWTAAAAEYMTALGSLDLGAVRCPVLVFKCAEDATVDLGIMDAVAAKFARGTCLALPGGHDPFFGNRSVREELWAAIEKTFSLPVKNYDASMPILRL
ncbi:Alpha/Beta hydrolase protein [Hyaloraphidium curvatum]|nr:Alpha/Beta hydrolase protein [Hyaloraphidium curvatum]